MRVALRLHQWSDDVLDDSKELRRTATLRDDANVSRQDKLTPKEHALHSKWNTPLKAYLKRGSVVWRKMVEWNNVQSKRRG